MNRVVNFFKNEFPLYVLMIYSVGYVFLSVFYINFSINIIYHISFQDLLLTTIKLLIILGAAMLLVVTVTDVLPGYYVKQKKGELEIDFETRYERASIWIYLLIVLVFLFVPHREYTFSVLLPLLPLKFYKIISMNETPEEKKKTRWFLTIMIVFILGLIACVLGLMESSNCKKGGGLIFSDYEVSFTVNDECFSTFKGDNYYFLGETSSTIFLYHKEHKNTHIFLKSEIHDFVVLDPDVHKEKFLSKAKFWLLKHLVNE